MVVSNEDEQKPTRFGRKSSQTYLMDDPSASSSIDNNNNNSNTTTTTTTGLRQRINSRRENDEGEEEEDHGSEIMGDNSGDFKLRYYTDLHNEKQIPVLGQLHPHWFRKTISEGSTPVQVVAVFFGCFFTYMMSEYIACFHQSVAPLLTITLACSAYPQLSASAAAGAFAGMTQLPVSNTSPDASIPNPQDWGWLALLSGLTAIVWLAGFSRHKLLVGFGGRIGTAAFLAQNLFQLIVMIPSGNADWSSYGGPNWTSYEGEKTAWWFSAKGNPFFIAAVFGGITIVTFLSGLTITTSKLPLNPIQTPANIALVLMIIYWAFPGFSDDEKHLISEAVAIGAVESMADSVRYFPSVWDYVVAGWFAGCWGILWMPFFHGFAGRLGFSACCGFCTHWIAKKIMVFVLVDGPFRRCCKKDDDKSTTRDNEGNEQEAENKQEADDV